MVDLILCEYGPPLEPGDALDPVVARGPRVLLNAGLIPSLSAAGVRVFDVSLVPEADCGSLQRKDLLEHVSARLASRVAASIAAGHFPITLGDCTAAIGVCAGMRRLEGRRAVVWVDAHADLNSEDSSLTGFYGGMPLGALIGKSLPWLAAELRMTRFCDEENVSVVGVRSLDPYEGDYLNRSPMARVECAELEGDASTEALARISRSLGEAGPVYLHVDVDALDPAIMPAVTFPCPGGLTLESLLVAVRVAASTGRVAAVTVASFNPGKGVSAGVLGVLVSLVCEVASLCSSAGR
ncbi:MAG: arginase family protein [Firmicutes bacterium]|jgi:arginase|nr:arginase family protein [Bacillota bacterium]